MRFQIFLLIFIVAGKLVAQDMVEWRGPHRSGVYPDKDLLRSWPEGGPKLLLTIDGIGNGYSSPVVYKSNIYVTGRKDTMDVISAYSPEGQKKWETFHQIISGYGRE